MPRRHPAPAADATVVPAAALLADRARVAMLWALVDGRALPIGDLARVAAIGAPTASAHLRRLVSAGWVGVEQHGRHRYVRLLDGNVAAVLEALATVGGAKAGRDPGASRVDPALRLARSCYDHLAGRAGVELTAAMVEGGLLAPEGRTYRITEAGRERFGELGIDSMELTESSRRSGRYLARACLDWSERRYHVAGALGHAVLLRVLELGWFERRRGTRALRLTNVGRRAVQREFGVRLV